MAGYSPMAVKEILITPPKDEKLQDDFSSFTLGKEVKATGKLGTQWKLKRRTSVTGETREVSELKVGFMDQQAVEWTSTLDTTRDINTAFPLTSYMTDVPSSSTVKDTLVYEYVAALTKIQTFMLQ